MAETMKIAKATIWLTNLIAAGCKPNRSQLDNGQGGSSQ